MQEIILPIQSVDDHQLIKKQRLTKFQIISSAARLFAMSGFHGTSTQDIAMVVQIRKSSLFHHFQSKEDIAVAAIEYVDALLKSNLYSQCGNSEQFMNAFAQLLSEHADELFVLYIGVELKNTSAKLAGAVEKFFLSLDAALKMLIENDGNTKNPHQLLTVMLGALNLHRLRMNFDGVTLVRNYLQS